VFTLFCTDWLGLTRSQAEHWWAGRRRSEAPGLIELRSAVLCMAALPYSRAKLEYLVRTNLRPQVTVRSVEVLVETGALTRAQASVITEAILERTTAHGGWYDGKPVTREETQHV
jgi:hypothetical protein